MFIDMTCTCMAGLRVDDEESNPKFLDWAERFVEAHQACGFMSVSKPEGSIGRVEFRFGSEN